ncbi:MAG: hypothetical protein OXR07_05375 [Nitrospira sp.]|nr:hypothetical protein [Nitrospira sp.]
MQVLVADTSVFIDREHGGLLEASFRLECRFVVPNQLYEDELKNYNGKELRRLGLVVEKMDDDSVSLAQTYQLRNDDLSAPDCSALALARTLPGVLLTGDNELRQFAIAEAVECHGVLWLLDKIETAAVVDFQELYRGLTAMWHHPHCRLPEQEVHRRLARYAERLP